MFKNKQTKTNMKMITLCIFNYTTGTGIEKNNLPLACQRVKAGSPLSCHILTFFLVDSESFT